MSRISKTVSMIAVICMVFSCAACKDFPNSANTVEFSSTQSQSSTIPSVPQSSIPSSSSTPPIFSHPPEIWPPTPTTPPKKEVHVLMGRNYTTTEVAVINAYTKKYGVKIRTTVTDEAQYITKLISLISGRDSPDAVCLSADRFPGIVTKCLIQLNHNYLHDSIWNEKYMAYYKVNGCYFGVAISGSPECETGSYCTYYNPDVLKACGVTTMPYTLYQQGKWNWDLQHQIAEKVLAKSPDNTGILLQDVGVFMHSAGKDFVTYDGKQFVNTLGKVKSADLLAKGWAEVSSLSKNGLSGGFDLKKFTDGKAGLLTATTDGLFHESGWFDSLKTEGGTAGLQAVPVAGPVGSAAYTPISIKLWGVAKGADNSEGACYFLRYFLDPSNMSMSKMFYNKQFEMAYKISASISTKKSITYSSGVIDYINKGVYNTLVSQLVGTAPDKMADVLNQKKATVDSCLKKANSDLGKIKQPQPVTIWERQSGIK